MLLRIFLETCRDLGALVDLSNIHTVGNLFSLLGGGFKVEGRIARFTYASLYRRHIIEVFGPVKGVLIPNSRP